MSAKKGAAAGGKKAGGPSSKTIQKKKEKIIEDKTFGLKNKNKSKKVQAYVQQVTKQVQTAGRGKPARDKPGEMPKKSKAELEKERLAELNMLHRPAVKKQPPQALPEGVDPKSILCQYFAQGNCNKGDRCKFSHDPNVARKNQKIDLYTDPRGANAPPDTVAPCSHFLDAVEGKRYGFFWVCPNNGASCQFLHCLPKGVVLKEDVAFDPAIALAGGDSEETPLEQILEDERRKLQGKGTPVTLERFLAWRDKKQREKEERALAAENPHSANNKDGDSTSISALKSKSARKALSGRQMFIYRPELFVDDEDAADEDTYAHSEDAPDPDVPINIIEATGTSLTRTAVTFTTIVAPEDQICWAPLDPSLFENIPLPPELRVK